jgi:hypothetical protein
MIHAYLFVTQRNDNHGMTSKKDTQFIHLLLDGHGPEFLYEAKRINELTDLNISVYHK